ncbi:MAG TPA: multidrug ABC transporter ATP-binding protein, partial [Virgibacillus sp.]|nr:multidrug ABC transporter ATP-binding protein [Virgibacillus sp.]
EIKIQDALQTLMHNRTSFVIAHRLNTIQAADKIIMLADGEVLEQGSHEQLIQLRGAYYHLYKAQLQKETNV